MSVPTLTLADFLLARIAEDEAEIAAGFDFAILDSSGWMGHAATWGRARALAECEAKRRIVEALRYVAGEDADHAWAALHGDNAQQVAIATLRLLALPYVEHPDYRAEWRP